ncbi:MAG: 7-cyano-7-deazaguanine synthase [Kiritimatiellaeota bacterium]|nr:7-cyano-7-deazaguanine synthase [Kiritimatiellota bacterium]
MKAIVADTPSACDLPLVPLQNLVTGREAFRKAFKSITTMEDDCLNLAAAVYASDLATKRSPAEDFVRDIELHVHVVNHQAFERVRTEIESALYFLSNDNWSIKFLNKQGSPESAQTWKYTDGVTLLFSGGLDSLAGAAHFLSTGTPLVLVSHVTHNLSTRRSQESLIEMLQVRLATTIDRFPFMVFARQHGKYIFPSDNDREDTQRTRSFLFLMLAALVARRTGFRRIVAMAENGQFAIHLPLTAARIGPFSTHTAHPRFLSAMQALLQKLLSCSDIAIQNPFVYKTKAEVAGMIPPSLRDCIKTSVSCWMTSRLRSKNHCGQCVPCLSRRIALESMGIKIDEYERDILQERVGDLPSDDLGKRNLIDLIEFVSRFSSGSSDDDLLAAFPELYDDSFDQAQVLAMYKRFANQASAVLVSYPHIKSIIG